MCDSNSRRIIHKMESSSKNLDKSNPNIDIVPQEHHRQAEFCTTRAAYRQGKEYKAVKVYTINDESQHLLIHNVPSVGLLEEISRLVNKLGKTDFVKKLQDYPVQYEFSDVYYVKYKLLKDARQAKKRLDNRSFFGNLLHVCYAPELETVDECRAKLKERNSFIQKIWKGAGYTAPTTHSQLDQSTAHSTGKWSNLLPSSSSTLVRKD